MSRPSLELVSELVLMDYRRVTQRLVLEAIEEWDRIGEGCFAEWVLLVVGVKWQDFEQSN